MNLLSIFHTGGLTLGLTLVWLLLVGIFIYQAYKGHKSEYGFYNPAPPGNWVKMADKTPLKKIPFFWGAIIVTLIYIIVLFIVGSDYKGV